MPCVCMHVCAWNSVVLIFTCIHTGPAIVIECKPFKIILLCTVSHVVGHAGVIYVLLVYL